MDARLRWLRRASLLYWAKGRIDELLASPPRSVQEYHAIMSLNEPPVQPAAPPDAAREEIPALYTIGYGARTVEEFIATLRTHHIDYLIDVRTTPFSKFKPDFTKELLQHHLERAGLRYLFMGDTLGGQPK